jgi:hypothetical protein
LAPGKNEIKWFAFDKKGNRASVIQIVNVHPLISFGRDKVTVEGGRIEIPILLNGLSPIYPLTVPIVISELSSATENDYVFTGLNAVFIEGEVESSIVVNITTDDINESSESLIIGFTQSINDESEFVPFNKGAKDEFELTIVEENIAPEVNLSIKQSNSETIMVSKSDGVVVITAHVIDPNIDEEHTYDWSLTDSSLINENNTVQSDEYIFDPSLLEPGTYEIILAVSDRQSAVDTVHTYILVVESLPILVSSQDSDNDGIDDLTEGTSDDDNDGIPDYLDNIKMENVLPASATVTDSFLIECEPGVSCRLSQFSLVSLSGGAQLGENDINNQETLSEDNDYTLSGGIFDFAVVGIPLGSQTSIVIPQSEAIPANATYRKFQNNQWQTFVENGNNSVQSTQGQLGYCPPPKDDMWENGLIEGYFCVQLTIEDGGPNDADGVANSTVVDPGSIGVAKEMIPEEIPVINSKNKSGSTSWLLFILAFMVMIKTSQRIKKKTQ